MNEKLPGGLELDMTTQGDAPNSLYQRVERALNTDGFQDQLSALGFPSAAEVMRHESFSHLCETARTAGTDAVMPSYEFYKAAAMRKATAEQILRDLLVAQDPVTLSLRDVTAPVMPAAVLEEFRSEPIRYANPNSIQSNQSPAAYLAHIYGLAKKIKPSKEDLALDARRPDLSELVLSDDNIWKEIGTLEIVNEILQAKLKQGFGLTNDADLFKKLKTQLHPLALPFDKSLAVVRTSLAAIPGMSVNEIARQQLLDDYALNAESFSPLRYIPDELALSIVETDALKSDADGQDNISMLFGSSPLSGFIDDLTAALDLTFEEFRQLFRDYEVRDEAGKLHLPGERGRRLIKANIKLTVDTTGRLKMVDADKKPVAKRVFIQMNHLARLYRKTGFKFHELDSLLCSIPGASKNGLITDTGLHVLAHARHWRERHGLKAEQFVAMLTEVNGFRRVGEQEEPTLWRQLFGDDASYVFAKIDGGQIEFAAVEADEAGRRLGPIIRRGLKLTRSEWDRLVALVTASAPTTTLNQATLACLYRLARVFPLLGWPILPGVALLGEIDAVWLQELASHAGETGFDPAAAIRSMEKLVWLADWMKDARLSAETLLRALIAPGDVTLQRTQAIEDWQRSLGQAVALHLIRDEVQFQAYREWTGDAGATVAINDWCDQLARHGIIGSHHLVCQDQSTIVDAVTNILKGKGVSVSRNENLALDLVGFLQNAENAQQQTLYEHIAKITKDNQNTALAVPILNWMDRTPYDVLDVLSANVGANDSEALFIYYDLKRHLEISSLLSLAPVTIQVFASKPDWLAPGLDKALSLRQIYYLQAFQSLQHAEAGADMWLAYLAAAQSFATPEQVDSGNALLSFLLQLDKAEMVALRGKEALATVQELDHLARRIQLCRDLCVGATELADLSAYGHDMPDPDTAQSARNKQKAADGILSGLARSEEKRRAVLARDSFNETTRDALVAAFRSTVSKSSSLQEIVSDNEKLYTYLLLDVNASSAVPTSRVVEATTSVQMFIERAIAGLEPATSWGDAGKDALLDEWETAKRYRIWEANKKLDLYPSNYIEPELRYNKSRLFSDFENTLSNGILNEDMIEGALSSYTRELQHLADLQPVGFCHFWNGDDARFLNYYFTAEASWQRSRYFHRHLRVDTELLKTANRQAFQWGEWRQVDLPVMSDTIFGVYPAFAWNRLFILWFELEEKRESDGRTQRFYLRPKYSRQLADGSFGDPREPEMSPSVLADLTFASKPLLTLNQPCYNTWHISMLFKLNTVKQFAFEIARDQAYVLENSRAVPSAPALNAYAGVVTSFVSDTLVITPATGRFYGQMTILGTQVILNEAGSKNLSFLQDEKGRLSVKFSGMEYKILYNANQPAGSETYGLYSFVNGAATHHGDKVTSKTVASFGNTRVYRVEQTAPIIIDIGTAGEFTMGFGVVAPGWGNSGAAATFAHTFYMEPAMVTCGTDRTTTDYLYANKKGSSKNEAYLVANNLSGNGSRHVVHLVSEGLRELVQVLPLPGGSRPFFSLKNQSYKEFKVADFLADVETQPLLQPLSQPLPLKEFDFDGPMGLYGWELFYHIPAFLAEKYADDGDFGAASKWMRCIFDPTAPSPWGVVPLVGARAAETNFDRSIIDPDYEALKNPVHYQQAAIRHHLEHLLAEGDASYREETREALQRAKMLYVTAKALFREEFAGQLDVLVASDWANPKLKDVTADSFRPPYNAELRKFYETFASRLHNLRNWLSIDGEPLNVSLFAAPIRPGQLQAIALSGMSAAGATTAAGASGLSQVSLPFCFAFMLPKAQMYAKELMKFADRLRLIVEKRDERALLEMKQQNDVDLYDTFSIGTQQVEVEIARQRKKALEKAKQTLEAELRWQERFADERMNGFEATAIALRTTKAWVWVDAMKAYLAAGGVKLFPNVAGMSVGGSRYEGAMEAYGKFSELLSSLIDDQVSSFADGGNFQRRLEEAQAQRDVIRAKIAELTYQLDDGQSDQYDSKSEQSHLVAQQEGTLAELRWKFERSKQMMELLRRNFTNSQLYNWYIGEVSALYRASYDATLRFAKLAEKAYQQEKNDTTASFIGYHWDARTKGLAAGQALWVDLERMDLAYWTKVVPKPSIRKTFLLSELEPTLLPSLRARGEIVFCLVEEMFEEDYPDVSNRQIEGVRVTFPGFRDGSPGPRGRLTQIDNKVFYDGRQSGTGRSLFNPCTGQSIVLDQWQTDSRDVRLPQGHLKPFQGTGVQSTWHLALPSTIKALKQKNESLAKTTLNRIDEVTFEIFYTVQV